mmetsp:Transcript_14208/g.19907  ORF Transcript_14208/g.19907 Transcript_14208/m.19907 type:complete len:88 (+) Transcript_14208:175-438(+)
MESTMKKRERLYGDANKLMMMPIARVGRGTFQRKQKWIVSKKRGFTMMHINLIVAIHFGWLRREGPTDHVSPLSKTNNTMQKANADT